MKKTCYMPFKCILTEEDCDQLQKDLVLDHMYDWTTTFAAEIFHPEKCCVMRVGSSNVNKREYTSGPDKAVLRTVSEGKRTKQTLKSLLTTRCLSPTTWPQKLRRQTL